MKRKGGYNRRNFLLKVQAVNEIFIQHSSRGVTNEYIYKNYIAKQFYISRTTFYEYLTIPYKSQLEKLDKIQAQQQSLFDNNQENETI